MPIVENWDELVAGRKYNLYMSGDRTATHRNAIFTGIRPQGGKVSACFEVGRGSEEFWQDSWEVRPARQPRRR